MGFSELVATVLGAGKQVGGILSDKAKDARDYAKDATELAGLKKQISSNRQVLKDNYAALGE